jgi:ABC-type proline/glycine betaine transport system permease subunit
MWLGSIASLFIVAVGLALLPSRPGRKSAVLGSAFVTAVVMWFVAFSQLGDFLYRSVRQSVVPWIILTGVPPMLIAAVIYYAFSRPLAADKKGKEA